MVSVARATYVQKPTRRIKSLNLGSSPGEDHRSKKKEKTRYASLSHFWLDQLNPSCRSGEGISAPQSLAWCSRTHDPRPAPQTPSCSGPQESPTIRPNADGALSEWGDQRALLVLRA